MKKRFLPSVRQAVATALSLTLGLAASRSPALSQLLLPSIWERPPQTAAPDLSELKIVVISGEDGVNIVRKKTAVQPVLEVRDKNNLPVSGAVVNFTTPNTGATAVFSNGSHTLTLVTDSTGRAVATGMHPVSTGAFHIAVSAAVQGHVAATATIAQANFLTAAAATGAGAAGAGAAAGSVAGISVGVVAGIAGGLAAAAVIAAVVVTHVGGKAATVSAVSGTVNFAPPH